jgi:hypothetical protein
MDLFLDCWLDTSTPHIKIFSKTSQYPLLEFTGNELQQLLEEQFIDITELYHKNTMAEKNIIDDLFFYAKQKYIQ